MKILHRMAMLLMTLALCMGTTVALAAPNYENPFEDAYKEAAAELHEQGTAKVVYLLLDTNRAPLAGATLVFNTNEQRGQQLVADKEGKIEFDLKKPLLIYIRSVIVGNRNVPIGGDRLVADMTRNDIHRGTVKYYVLHRYSSATFMVYDAGGDGRFY